jgi:hypothetical protein
VLLYLRMKCPHCNNGIYEGFSETVAATSAAVSSREGKVFAGPVQWAFIFQRCPECHESIVFLKRTYFPYTAPNAQGQQQAFPAPAPPLSFMAFPKSQTRTIPPEVVEPYRQDFSEACKVLADSAKASAALSRRCLQSILRDRAGTTNKDLYDQIEEVIAAGKVPSHIAEGLYAVRTIGNFAAHPLKSTATGVILDVEPGEAEWNLDILESLFDFYFVQPAISAKRKAELNKKLKDAGKPELP